MVTGATEGIGRAIAFALGGHGARVAICSRTAGNVDAAVAALRETGIDALGSACDVASEPSVASFASFLDERLGHVDVLVNNAGVGHAGNVDEMSVQAFDETISVNVRGVFLMTRAILPGMRRRRSGTVVNIASLAGKNPVPGAAAYAASKHAVLGFSKSLMLEVRKEGIRVLTICPGSVVTTFFEKAGMQLANQDRKLQAEDVAHAVVAAVQLPDHANLSDLDIRPANP